MHELAGSAARGAPLAKERTCAVEHRDPVMGLVGHEYVAGAVDGEGLGRPELARPCAVALRLPAVDLPVAAPHPRRVEARHRVGVEHENVAARRIEYDGARRPLVVWGGHA